MKTHSSLLFCQMNDLFLLLNTLTRTKFVSNFRSGFVFIVFILFTAFVLRKSTEQGKLEKSHVSCFLRPASTTRPAPCAALPITPTPSLSLSDFLKGTHLHFKHRLSSGVVTTSRRRDSYSDYTSWIYCPQRSETHFFQDSQLTFLVLKQHL